MATNNKIKAAPKVKKPAPIDPRSVTGSGSNLTQHAPGGLNRAWAVPLSETTSGKGAFVDPSVTGARAGTTMSAPQGVLQKALGGVSQTTTRTPMYSPLTGQLLSLQERTTAENPLSTQDLAATALGDVDAYRAAKEETREIAQQALAGVEQSYGTALDEMTGQFGEAEGLIRGNQPEFKDVEGQFERAWGMTEEAAGTAKSYAAEQTERAEAWRTEALDAYTDQFALRHDNLRRGMERSYNQRMDRLDASLAQGRIVAQGGMSAGQVGAAAKAQLKSEYMDQLRGLSGQLAAEESRISSALRAQVDQYSLASIGQAQGMSAGAQMQGANVGAQLAAAEAHARGVFASIGQQGELGLLQADLAIQKLRVEEPQLATEIMLSRAYLPDAIAMYPLMKELSEMYDEEVPDGTQLGGPSLVGYTQAGGAQWNWGGGGAAGVAPKLGAGKGGGGGGAARGGGGAKGGDSTTADFIAGRGAFAPRA